MFVCMNVGVICKFIYLNVSIYVVDWLYMYVNALNILGNGEDNLFVFILIFLYIVFIVNCVL